MKQAGINPSHHSVPLQLGWNLPKKMEVSNFFRDIFWRIFLGGKFHKNAGVGTLVLNEYF